jgi:PAS domain S-box-containing protein
MEQDEKTLDYRLLYEMAPCGYLLLDDHRKIVSLNSTFAQWVGLSKPELEGMSIDRMVNPHTEAFLINHYFPLLLSQGSIQQVFLDLTVNGIKLECHVHGRIISPDEPEDTNQFLLTLQNHSDSNAIKLTKQKQYDQIQAHYEHSKNMVSDYQKAIFHKTLGLNTKINQLENNIDILHSNALVRHDGRHIAHALRSISYSAIRTLGDLSDYFHLDPQPSLSSVNIEEVCRKVVADFKNNPSYMDATFLLDSLPKVKGCKKQLRLLLFHLIHNALTFKSHAVPILRVTAIPFNGLVKICVIDNGRGIEEHNQKKIFDFMVRIPSDLEGSGIGLAICRRIMAIHSGTLEVDSRYGNGSNFHFTLPLAEKVP